MSTPQEFGFFEKYCEINGLDECCIDRLNRQAKSETYKSGSGLSATTMQKSVSLHLILAATTSTVISVLPPPAW